MQKQLKILALAAAIASPFIVIAQTAAADKNDAAATSTNDNKISSQLTEAKILSEAAIAKYPMFSVLIADNPKFRDTWESKIAVAAIVLPKSQKDSLALNVGLELALTESEYYLPKADDASVNSYIAGLAHIMQMGASDVTVCQQMLPGKKPKLSAKEEAELEARFAPEMISKLYPGVSSVIISGRNGRVNILKKDEMDAAIMPVVMGMAKKHGEEAITGLTSFADESQPPTQRCQVMAWMMESILEQPEKERALLSRTMFSKESRKTVDAE